VDIGYLAGIETHPKRIAYQDVMKMSEGDRAAFDARVPARLLDLAAALSQNEATLAPRCAGADEALRPYCEEIRDGVAVLARRARHSAHLYRSILALAKGADPEADFAAAKAERDAAQAFVTSREKAYRFDLHRMVDAFPNPTVYPFGYLRPAHDLCYWQRQEQQVRSLVDDGAPLPVGAGRTCVGD
jgi:hypothetical protein